MSESLDYFCDERRRVVDLLLAYGRTSQNYGCPTVLTPDRRHDATGVVDDVHRVDVGRGRAQVDVGTNLERVEVSYVDRAVRGALLEVAERDLLPVDYGVPGHARAVLHVKRVNQDSERHAVDHHENADDAEPLLGRAAHPRGVSVRLHFILFLAFATACGYKGEVHRCTEFKPCAT